MSLSYKIVDIDANPIIVTEIFHNGIKQTDEEFTAGTDSNSIHESLLTTFGIEKIDVIPKSISVLITTTTSYSKSFKLATYESVGHFIFSGSNKVGIPKKIKATVFIEKISSPANIRIRDITNSNTIAEKTNITNTLEEIIDLGNISNIPTGEAIFEIQTNTTGGKFVYISSLLFEF